MNQSALLFEPWTASTGRFVWNPWLPTTKRRRQDIERVLNIFIRCNRGGTPLSYSNLLASIPRRMSKWNQLDARREVHGLVDEMNNVRAGLLFNADFVLKAGLMLTDIASVGIQGGELHAITTWPSWRRTGRISDRPCWKQ